MITENPPARITDNLWMLGTSAYPLYLYQGSSEAVVFEGGTGPMGPMLKEQLAELDIAPDAVKQIVVTHAHPDHVMAVPAMRELFAQATVLASEVASKVMGSEKALAHFQQVDEALTGSLLKAGVIHEQHRPKPLTENRIAVDRILAEGDKVTLGDVAFEVFAAPGHSDCSLVFFEPGAKILVVSDATGYYLPQPNCWWPLYFADYDAYIGTMRRLAEFDAEVLCLGHNAVLQGSEAIRDYFQRVVDATEAYHRRVLEEHESGKNVRAIAETLGVETYELTQLLPLDIFQKYCGVLVKQSFQHENIETGK